MKNIRYKCHRSHTFFKPSIEACKTCGQYHCTECHPFKFHEYPDDRDPEPRCNDCVSLAPSCTCVNVQSITKCYNCRKVICARNSCILRSKEIKLPIKSTLFVVEPKVFYCLSCTNCNCNDREIAKRILRCSECKTLTCLECDADVYEWEPICRGKLGYEELKVLCGKPSCQMEKKECVTCNEVASKGNGDGKCHICDQFVHFDCWNRHEDIHYSDYCARACEDCDKIACQGCMPYQKCKNCFPKCFICQEPKVCSWDDAPDDWCDDYLEGFSCTQCQNRCCFECVLPCALCGLIYEHCIDEPTGKCSKCSKYCPEIGRAHV